MKLQSSISFILFVSFSIISCFPTSTGIKHKRPPRAEAAKPDKPDKPTSLVTKPESETDLTTLGTGVLKQGSSTILNACWTKKELAGSPQDKKRQRPIKNPFRGPPAIRVPYHQNQKVEHKLRNSIRRVIPRSNEKIVALTFDLCERTQERTGYDAQLVNYLRKHKIRATFYAGGKWMHSHPEKAKQLMADPLFEIGNHAWTHGNLRVLKGHEMKNQILWTQGQYEVLRNQLRTLGVRSFKS